MVAVSALLVIICVYGAFKIYSMRRLDLPLQRRRFLVILQSIAIILIALPLANIVVGGFRQKIEHKEINIFVDNSLSVRKYFTSTHISNLLYEATNSIDGRIYVSTFGESIKEGQISLDENASIIRPVSIYASSKKAFILSDGFISADSRDYESLKNAYFVSLKREVTNASIVLASAPKNCVAGEKAVFSFNVYPKEKEVLVSCYENGKLFKKAVCKNSFLSISYIPKDAGEKTLVFRTESFENEYTDFDNTVYYRVDVVEGKTPVVLLSGSPTKDVGILANFLTEEKSLVLTKHFFNPKKDEVFSIPNHTRMIFVVSPSKKMIESVGSQIRRFLKRGVPMCVIHSDRSETIQGYENIFPSLEKKYGDFKLNNASENSPINLSYDYEANEKIWQSFTFFNSLFVSPKIDGQILVEANNTPAIVYSKKDYKIIHILIAPLYRLKLYGKTLGLDKYYDTLFASMITTLLSDVDNKPMYASKKTIETGEKTRIILSEKVDGKISVEYINGLYTTNKPYEINLNNKREFYFTPKYAGVVRLFVSSRKGYSTTIAVNNSSFEISESGFHNAFSNSYKTFTKEVLERNMEESYEIKEKSLTLHRSVLYAILVLVALSVLWAAKRIYGLS